MNGGRVVDDGEPDDITRRYEGMHRDAGVGESGAADRVNPPPEYHLRRVELRDSAGVVTNRFDAGDVMTIHLWASGPAPENSYTVEFKLFNSQDQVISFGAANPVRDTYFQSGDTHFICRLGPLPLTEGAYTFSFTVRVWNTVRWDYWDRAIGFDIVRCDLFKTGHGISNAHDGDFVIQQEWIVGD
jgi:Wzt C-terminal domain